MWWWHRKEFLQIEVGSCSGSIRRFALPSDVCAPVIRSVGSLFTESPKDRGSHLFELKSEKSSVRRIPQKRLISCPVVVIVKYPFNDFTSSVRVFLSSWNTAEPAVKCGRARTRRRNARTESTEFTETQSLWREPIARTLNAKRRTLNAKSPICSELPRQLTISVRLVS
jgi:hypothetical protein